MKVVYNSYAPKPYCNLFSHGELGLAGLDGLYKEVTPTHRHTHICAVLQA